MGLLTSVNNINYTIEEQRKQKTLEKIQKQKEKTSNNIVLINIYYLT